METLGSRAVCGVTKWLFPQAGGNALQSLAGNPVFESPARRKFFTESFRSKSLAHVTQGISETPSGIRAEKWSFDLIEGYGLP